MRIRIKSVPWNKRSIVVGDGMQADVKCQISDVYIQCQCYDTLSRHHVNPICHTILTIAFNFIVDKNQPYLIIFTICFNLINSDNKVENKYFGICISVCLGVRSQLFSFCRVQSRYLRS